MYKSRVKSLNGIVQREVSSLFKALDEKWAMLCLKQNEWYFTQKIRNIYAINLILHIVQNNIVKKHVHGHMMFVGDLKAHHYAQHASAINMLVRMILRRLMIEGE